MNDTVTGADLVQVNNGGACFGQSATSTQCPDYAYWVRPAFHSGTSTIGTGEALTVGLQYQDGGVTPFSWTGTAQQAGTGTLDNVATYPGTCTHATTGQLC